MLGAVPLGQREHWVGRRGGQKVLKGRYPAIIICKLLTIICLAVSSESANLRKWYRPNPQAARLKTSAYPKSFSSGYCRSWTAEAYMLPRVIWGMPTLLWRRKDEPSHCQLGNSSFFLSFFFFSPS